MKRFKDILLEYGEFQRTDKRRSVSTLHASGSYNPSESGHVEFTTYHGGNFGEEGDSESILKNISRTPSERLSRMETGVRITPGQPEHSFLGLSTTPDATAAREYRSRSNRSFVANPKANIEPSERLYEIKGRVHKDNLRTFRSYDEFDNWYSKSKSEALQSLYKDKKYIDMSKTRDKLLKTKNPKIYQHNEMMNSYMLDHIHGHITKNLGVHAAIIGTNQESDAGSGRAKYSGEIMLFKPHETITSISERGKEVDTERERIGPALKRLRSIQKLRK